MGFSAFSSLFFNAIIKEWKIMRNLSLSNRSCLVFKRWQISAVKVLHLLSSHSLYYVKKNTHTHDNQAPRNQTKQISKRKFCSLHGKFFKRQMKNWRTSHDRRSKIRKKSKKSQIFVIPFIRSCTWVWR